MASIFSKIVTGEIPCHKVAEDENYLAFLDINPLAKGHTLVIPKKETDYIFNLGINEYSGLWVFAQKVARAIDAVIPCKRVGVAVLGLEVPHAHIHLVPINGIYDIDFSKPKLTLTASEFSDIAAAIQASYQQGKTKPV
ncbi:MAG: HIT family protein [Bacteroidales bacterium]|jgi:histidine triad (HIT) family protein|nr:HIT family protein [Bacteroidales bacterium]MDD2322273.1 HIT family protein [Bacteroidales bacterium]MDD3011387.1 HIT family protein [Bacteroidales bacterium]MDY0285372.1 HIT family protein [Bacteroidales bacterium]HPE86871.1 HIT family protein [Bacteroidales bacterium]